jgi:hypothetical protein
MSEHSSGNPRPRKDADRPQKPYPDFPLTPHPSGFWQKKIRGKICSFGKWARRVDGKLVRVEGDGWKEALEDYKAKADALHAGRGRKDNGLTGLRFKLRRSSRVHRTGSEPDGTRTRRTPTWPPDQPGSPPSQVDARQCLAPS